jgi:hypothetical protein
MKLTRSSLLIVAVTILSTLPISVWGSEPESPRTKGHVLVLANERTMQGEIERDGDQYRVRRSVGETGVPADSVICLCDTLEEAYAFLRSRANLQDADERMRLARWCQLHGLRTQALAEVQAAVDLRPSSKACQRLLQSLERASVAADGASPQGPRKNGAEAGMPPSIEISSESMGQFISRVQPILMNTCASCHVGDKGGAFRLARASEGGTVSRRATQQNLAAVLARITPGRPEASPVLVKAVSVHGEASQPPIKTRQAPAYRAIEDWIRATIAGNPQLEGAAATAVPRAAAPEQKSVSAPEPIQPGFAAGAPVSSSKPAIPASGAGAPSAAIPLDPFDPAGFNSQRQVKSKK